MRSRSMMAAVVLGTALASGQGSAAVGNRAIDDISRYCQACWRNARLPADHWPDATQQVFVRLLERLDPTRWQAAIASEEGEERREFLRAIDAVKKRTQRLRKFDSLHDTAGEPNTAADSRRNDRAWIDARAASLLSDRQRRILDLTFNGHEIPEIANVLGTTVERVSDEKYKAIRKLRAQSQREQFPASA